MTYDDGGKHLDENGPYTAISTYTGRDFDLCDPTSWDFHLEDIGRALSNTTRYQGHVDFYSVAEHCCSVSEWLQEQGHDHLTQYLGLLHDATEAYIGDIPRPQKKLMSFDGIPIEQYEDGMMAYLAAQHGFPRSQWGDRWAAVKAADYAVYLKEREQRPSPAFRGKAWVPERAYSEYIGRYWRLRREAGIA